MLAQGGNSKTLLHYKAAVHAASFHHGTGDGSSSVAAGVLSGWPSAGGGIHGRVVMIDLQWWCSASASTSTSTQFCKLDRPAIIWYGHSAVRVDDCGRSMAEGSWEVVASYTPRRRCSGRPIDRSASSSAVAGWGASGSAWCDCLSAWVSKHTCCQVPAECASHC